MIVNNQSQDSQPHCLLTIIQSKSPPCTRWIEDSVRSTTWHMECIQERFKLKATASVDSVCLIHCLQRSSGKSKPWTSYPGKVLLARIMCRKCSLIEGSPYNYSWGPQSLPPCCSLLSFHKATLIMIFGFTFRSYRYTSERSPFCEATAGPDIPHLSLLGMSQLEKALSIEAVLPGGTTS